MSKPHSEPWREAVLVVGRALDTAHPITGEDHDMVDQSTEALDVLVRQIEGLEEQLEASQKALVEILERDPYDLGYVQWVQRTANKAIVNPYPASRSEP